MPAENKRRRAVAACSQCYQKKQKCDRKYPCTNCARRRLPELCTYAFSEQELKGNKTVAAAQKSNRASPDESRPRSVSAETPSHTLFTVHQSEHSSPRPPNKVISNIDSLVFRMGYSEDSKSNLFGLMNKFDLLGLAKSSPEKACIALRDSLPEIRECLKVLPKRPIIDCLVQHFFEEANWFYEMMHAPLFLKQYEKWWTEFPGSSVENLEFGVLILRVCAYSAQFMPSQSHIEETVLGVPLDTVRLHCRDLATRLQAVTDSLEHSKTLTSVYHNFYHVSFLKNDGYVSEAWYTLGSAIEVAKAADVPMEITTGTIDKPAIAINEVEKDMRRRCFWNLFAFDQFLSHMLGRSPWIKYDASSISYPQMRFSPATSKPRIDCPDVFLGRLLQIRLSRLLATFRPKEKTSQGQYDPFCTEELYERLAGLIEECTPTFNLHHTDTQWDQDLPNVPRQRELLRISFCGAACQLFQPLLYLEKEDILEMPNFKKEIIFSQRNRLVEAATGLLNSVFHLHGLLGNRATRLFLLAFCTFHGAFLLVLDALWVVKIGELVPKRVESARLARIDFQPQSSGSAGHVKDWAQSRRFIERAMKLLHDIQHVSNIAKLGLVHLERALPKAIAVVEAAEGGPSHSAQMVQTRNEVMEGADSWLGYEFASSYQEPMDNTERPGDQTSQHSLFPTFVDTDMLPGLHNMYNNYRDSGSTVDSAIGNSSHSTTSTNDQMFNFPSDLEAAFDQWSTVPGPTLNPISGVKDSDSHFDEQAGDQAAAIYNIMH